MNWHAHSMRVDMCVAAVAPLPHVCSDQQGITSFGANQPSSAFFEAVAQFLQKRKLLAARHLQVRVAAHQMLLRARHAKEWDERHVEHGMSQTSAAQSVEQDRMRSIALVAAGRDVLCMLMQVAPMQPDSGMKTLQAFVDAHWLYQFATCRGVECVCRAWANVCGILGVARPPRAINALGLGTYGQGMHMKTSSPKNGGGNCWKAAWGCHVAQYIPPPTVTNWLPQHQSMAHQCPWPPR